MFDFVKRIIVFDTDEGDLVETANAVRACFAREGCSVEVAGFSDIRAVAWEFDEHNEDAGDCCMVFVGVDSMLGVEAARKIREELDFCAVPMYLISRAGDYAPERRRLKALECMAKPVTPGHVREAVRRWGVSKFPETGGVIPERALPILKMI